MHVEKLLAQDRMGGAIGQTLEGIGALADLAAYSQFRAAVAYATLSGCKILTQKIHSSPRWMQWKRCRKRWLISIDFGRTEPAALDFLAGLPQTEVRIPDGRKVLGRAGFSPVIPFHPKAYAVDDINDGGNSVFGIFLGSGNLTASGLLTGTECGTLSYWVDPNRRQRNAMIRAYRQMSWFEVVWERAEPLADVKGKYAALWKKSKPPIIEEDPRLTNLYVGGPGYVTSGVSAVALASAKALWVKLRKLPKNRGPNEAGNQVDLSRGTRVFFGFSPTSVPKNTIFGHVILQNEGYGQVECSVRFGNNMMDKLNLPVPGADGPASYDNSIILIERNGFAPGGTPRFQIRSGDEAELTNWKQASISQIDLKMKSGRRYGLLF